MHPLLRPCLPPLALLAATGLSAAQSFEVYDHPGTTNDQAGFSVAGLGDVDGDGVEDYAVGSPLDAVAGNYRGQVVVYSGKTGGVIYSHDGESDGDRFGWSVAGLGDINGDGRADYIVGAPLYDNTSIPNTGKVYVYSGKTGLAVYTLTYSEPGAQAGFAVCGPGDLDGDGTPDFAFTIPWSDSLTAGTLDSGRIYVYSGANVGFIWKRDGQADESVLGYSIDRVGDINGDGRPELVVGAPFEDKFTTGNGIGYVLDGATGATIFSRYGAWTGGALGHDVAGVGDVNGDGVPDVGFGEPRADTNGTDSGRVLVSSGAPPYLQLHQIVGPAGARTGTSLAGLGDADGDGRDDYAVGMPNAGFFGATNVGWVYLVSGASGTSFVTLLGESSGQHLGVASSGVGDLNDDGFADVIVGAPWDDSNGNNSGKARVFLSRFPAPSTYCTAKVNSGGCTPSIDSSGTPSASIADDFHVFASDILANVPGILIWSQTSASTPFGGGTLCLAAPVRRTPGQNSGGAPGQSCSGRFDLHFSHAFMASQHILPGMVLHAQYWSRDVGFAPPNNVNLTDALQFTVAP